MMTDGEQQLTSKSNEYSPCIRILLNTMRYIGEILLVILLALSSYASLQKGALKIQLQPPPVPLFENNSTVRDFYGGDVATPFSAVIQSDVSLVMYYTPWDFDSQLTKYEFERVANHYSGQVFSTAINCWVHNGACRQTFPKLRTFPLILGYVGGSKGVQYRGPLQYNYIVKFVQHLLKPLERVESIADLYRLLTKSSAVVTGYFNFNCTKPLGFYSFYVASLRYLEYDVHKPIQFATITNPKAASKLGIHSSKFDIRLHLWNETLIYPHNGSSIDVGRFLQWIYYRSHSPIQWIWPSSRKSQVIQHYLIDQQRPSLILFTPKLKESSQAMVVKEIALDYNNCASSPRIARLIQEIQNQRDMIEMARLAFESKCSIFGGEKKQCRRQNNVTVSVSVPEESCWSSSFWTTEQSIQGLGCRTNRSLNFFLMDTDQYPNFLAKLGYSTSQSRLNPNVVVIIDPKEESHYILNEPITRQNVEKMIINYTSNSLRRFRRSISLSKHCPAGRVCIRDISADEFNSVVLDPMHDVMVLYRKSGCVFCDVASRTFLRLLQMLSPSQVWKVPSELPEIKLVTIDGENNDLPWQYTVEKYPTVIFYPAFRKMDSRVFPRNLEMNIVNLLNFTLSQLSMRKRVTWFIHFCQDTSCLQEAQRQIGDRMMVIDQHVRVLRYRMSWLDDESVMKQLRDWMKERRFYQELNYAVLNSIASAARRIRRNKYPEGIRLAADE